MTLTLLVNILLINTLQKLILIDGNSIIHRAFYAIPPFETKNGELVNAAYGFASMLLTILKNEKPDYIAVSFDMRGKTFRHIEYKEYKATRKKAPDELYSQIPRIKEVVRTFKIPIYEVEGFEADDVLGTLAKQAEKIEDMDCYIVTGDRDALQLVGPRTKVISPIRGFNETIVYDTPKVLEKYGLKPSQITDMKGLQGDSSDNIKGVAGIGQKTAKTLLQKYGTIDNVYEHLDEITGAVHDRLKKDRDSAFFSRKLATIVLDTPTELDIEACKTHEYEKEKIEELFQELGFNSLLKKLNSVDGHYSEKNQAQNSAQATLF